MGELSLENLIERLNQARNVKFPYFMVSVRTKRGLSPEHIVFPFSSFSHKIDYYSKAYNGDLTLKANQEVHIVDYKILTSNILELKDGLN